MQTTGYTNWPGTGSSLERTADLEALHAFDMTQKELLTCPTVLNQISTQVFQMKGKRRGKRKGGRKKLQGITHHLGMQHFPTYVRRIKALKH